MQVSLAQVCLISRAHKTISHVCISDTLGANESCADGIVANTSTIKQLIVILDMELSCKDSVIALQLSDV